MARGRFISREISIDKKVNQLSDAWSMLGFTWLLTHADREGRTYGDPEVVKSIVFPRQSSITTEQMEAYILEWQAVGLIDRYEVDGEFFIEFPNFNKHQVGLRKDKEPPSVIPENLRKLSANLPEDIRKISGKITEDVRQSSGNFPSEVKEKLREVEDEDEVEVSPSGDNDNNNELISSFAQISHLQTSETWTEPALELEKMGVTPDILRQAYTELRAKGNYRITGLKSMVHACEQVIADRRNRDSPMRLRDSDGMFAQYVHH